MHTYMYIIIFAADESQQALEMALQRCWLVWPNMYLSHTIRHTLGTTLFRTLSSVPEMSRLQTFHCTCIYKQSLHAHTSTHLKVSAISMSWHTRLAISHTQSLLYTCTTCTLHVCYICSKYACSRSNHTHIILERIRECFWCELQCKWSN